MKFNAVGDLLDSGVVGGPAGVAVGAAAFAGAGAGTALAGGVEVVVAGQLPADVGQDDGELPRGERAARVAQSLAASMALVKLIRPGSNLGGAA